MVEKLRIKMRHLLTVTSLLAIVVSVPMLYQNCSQPLAERADASSVAQTAPFAYEARVDHFAYMSCSNMPSGYDTNAFFTFKAGAYNDGAGVKFNNAFVYEVRNLLQADKAAVLDLSPINKDVYMQMSVRQSSNLQTPFGINNMPYQANFVGSLSAPEIANELARVNGTSFTRTFPSGAKFEGRAQMTTSESLADTIRQQVSVNGNYLSLNYSRITNPSEAISTPSGSTTSVFGNGYKMAFVLGHGQTSNFSGGTARVMTNLSEYNLSNQSLTGANWECNANWVLMIVKPSDITAGRVVCNTEPEPSPSPAQLEMYETIRKVLPATEWGLDLFRRCIVPKKTGSCYGNSTALVNYNGGACLSADTCPHYVSICKRR